MCNQEKKLKKITRTSYSLTEKRSILDLYFKSGLSCRQFALQHGIDRSTLSIWLSSCKNAEKSVPLQSKLIGMDAKDEMLEKLRAENEKLRHYLEFERLRVRAYERLIEIVKEEDGIDVLKKDGAKQ
ncbi:MAG: transposase [Paludibacteraceae bacterium]|nr:transposase [Paludibacteraceae bacterium]